MVSTTVINKESSIRRAIVVCALGYFIDIFDVQSFPILRVSSLTELGVDADQLTVIGSYILDAQMTGMILGAFLWGWVGDKFGRLKALYGSILIYSLGTLACSIVQDPVTYGLLRFITGFGLAGETGAAITLVAELMSVQKRGWGVMIVAGIGVLGPAAAVSISWVLGWRHTYITAGIIGLVLLVLRLKLIEPHLFEKINQENHKRGSLKLLLQPQRARTIIYCLMMGLPLVYLWNLLNFLSVEFSPTVLSAGEIFNQKICLLCFYVGTSCGDFLSGTITQLWHSRIKTLVSFFAFSGIVVMAYMLLGPVVKMSATLLYATYFLLGIAGGCWVLMTMVYAEHFGTNIRATTSIVLTNLIRGFTIPLLFSFQALKNSMNITEAALIIGAILYGAAFYALAKLRETHGLDLDYVERLEKPKPLTSSP